MFWTVEVNDLLGFNLDGLKKVFASYLTQKSHERKRWMDFKEADYLMTQLMPDLKVNVKVARRCFVLSKMTIEDELKKIEGYNRL